LYGVEAVASQINKVLANFEELKYLEAKLPPTTMWSVVRLDICCMWDYQTYEQAMDMLNIVRNFNCNKHFDTTCYKGKSKFYLKQPEFMKNDFKRLYESGNKNMAYYLANRTLGYLRFEVRLDKETIYNIFKTNDILTILKHKYSDFKVILSKYLITWFNGSIPRYMTESEAYKILEQKYGYEYAVKLMWFLNTKINNKELLKTIPQVTRSRWSRKLKDAGVGYTAKTRVEFPSIESKYLVQPDLTNQEWADLKNFLPPSEIPANLLHRTEPEKMNMDFAF
jgi:hypothetical protein